MPVDAARALERCRSGDALFQNGKHEDAVVAYTRVLEDLASGKDAGKHGGTKYEARILDDFDALVKAVAPRLHLHRSVAYRQLGHWQEAEQDAARAVKLQPSSANACCNWVICLNLLNRLPAARHACDTGLARHPRNSALLKLRSEVLRHQQIETHKSDAPRCHATLCFPSGATAGAERDGRHTAMQTVKAKRGLVIERCAPIASRVHCSEPVSLLRRRLVPSRGATKLPSVTDKKVLVEPLQMSRQPQPKKQALEAHSSWVKHSKLLRRSTFARKMSLWWRLCRSEPRAQQLEKQGWKRFTPTVLNMERCFARTWHGGRGGQCSRAKCSHGSDFCRFHAAEQRWRTHGRVDGSIPAGKLREFLRASKPSVRTQRQRHMPSGLACASCLPATSPQEQLQEVSHVGSHVRVCGDGQVGGSCLGLVVSESADRVSFLVSVPPAEVAWSQRRVLRRHCTLLRPSASSLSHVVNKKRSPRAPAESGSAMEAPSQIRKKRRLACDHLVSLTV